MMISLETDPPKLVNRSARPVCYQPYWCEENIWQLADHPDLREKPRYAVFATNERHACPLWHQRAVAPDQRVLWDYHVVLAVQEDAGWEIWDLDTRLPLPMPAEEYLQKTFAQLEQLSTEFHPYFRVIDAVEYHHRFSSDRTHMLAADGTYLETPPPWPLIQHPDRDLTLARILDLQDPRTGDLMELPALTTRFAS